MCTVRKLINTQLEQRVIIIRFSSQNIWTTNNIGTSIKLPTDVKLYKDQKLFLKPFGYKVMTIYNSQLPFHHFQKTSTCSSKMSTWKHNTSCLKAIGVESQLDIK